LILIHIKFFIQETLLFCTDVFCSKLVSAIVVVSRFLEVFKRQYTGNFY